MGILSTTAFNTSVDMGIRDVSPDVVSTGYAAYLNVNTAFKDSPALVGKGTTRSCT